MSKIKTTVVTVCLESLSLCFQAPRVISGLLVEQYQQKEEWSSVTITYGALSVMIPGELMML